MTRATLKKNIHKAIDNIDDNSVLEAVYTLLSRFDSGSYDWDDNDIKIVEERRANYLSGKDKGVSLKEVNKRLRRKFPTNK